MELTVFKNSEFGSIRATSINGEPWLAGRDAAEILGYGDGNASSKAMANAIKDHVEEEDKRLIPFSELKGLQNGDLKKFSHYGAIFINESGLYSLIFGSKLPKAKEFKHWVTSEVLPSIRKNGGYIAGQETMTDSELIAKALLVAQRKIEERDKRIEQMRPKEIFADAVSASKSTILIGELAKIMKANGFDTGQNRLFETLRQDGFLISRKGTDYNMPSQYSVELGLMAIKETAITHSDGHVSITKTPKVTGKGQQYFINRYCAKASA